MQMEREKKYNYVRKTFSWDGKRYDVKGKTIEEVYKKIAKMKVSFRYFFSAALSWKAHLVFRGAESAQGFQVYGTRRESQE